MGFYWRVTCILGRAGGLVQVCQEAESGEPKGGGNIVVWLSFDTDYGQGISLVVLVDEYL